MCKPDIKASTLCNNTFLIGGRYLNTSSTTNSFRLKTTTGCYRTEHLNNKLKWNAAEWYSSCCRGKVLNLQGYSIQASGFICCVLKVALDTGQKNDMKFTMQKTAQTMAGANNKQVLNVKKLSIK